MLRCCMGVVFDVRGAVWEFEIIVRSEDDDGDDIKRRVRSERERRTRCHEWFISF